MNEALIHLYFYTILEKLQTHQFTSLHLVKIITETKKVHTLINFITYSKQQLHINTFY